MEYNRDEIANRIFLARKNKGLKQIELCNHLGMSQSRYSDVETGKRDITLPVLFNLSELLDAPIAWLLGVDHNADLTDYENLEIEKYTQYLISLRKSN